MSTDFEPSEELDRLLAALVEGLLDDAQRTRLNELVRDDPQACDFCAQYLATHGMLAWHHGGGEDLEIPLDVEVALPPLKPREGTWKMGLAVAAVLLVAVSLALYYSVGPGKPRPLATLIVADNLQWEGDSGPHGQGEALGAGRQRLAVGTAQLELRGGVMVALAAPVEFEVLGAGRFALHYGMMRALVPEAARGFTVETAKLEIVDVGTELGVSVDKLDNVQVHVFSGQVLINDEIHLKAPTARYITSQGHVKKAKLNEPPFPEIAR